MSEKTMIRIALVLAILLGVWAGLGGPVPFLKVKAFSPSDDVPTFGSSDSDDSGGERDFVGDEYNAERERQIDEMVEDAEDKHEKMMENEE